jgi:hypothetical protein
MHLFYLQVYAHPCMNQVSLQADGTIERIAETMRDIGLKLSLLNEYLRVLPVTNATKSDAMEVNRQLMILWLNVITMFRDPIHSLSPLFVLIKTSLRFTRSLR